MSTNKNAQIRYTILDRCFSNFNRLYTYDDLLDEINSVLVDLGTEGIKLRQLQYDISHMCSEAGWSIELDETLKKGRKRAFRYLDRNFSIANHPLNVNDAEQLETTLAILSRYKHREEFSWLEELIPRMEQAFDLVAAGENGIMSYQENFDLKGKEHIGTIFNLIVKKKQIKIDYEPYGKEPRKVALSPFHLKQYNNRWFLFGKHPEYETISNYPLDRILSIEELEYDVEPNNINWLDYFDEIIGVTKPEGIEIENIKLKFTANRINYVLTKPLHGTQRIDKNDESGLTVIIEVIPNPELKQLILSFGKDITVVEPQNLRNEIVAIINEMKDNY